MGKGNAAKYEKEPGPFATRPAGEAAARAILLSCYEMMTRYFSRKKKLFPKKLA